MLHKSSLSKPLFSIILKKISLNLSVNLYQGLYHPLWWYSRESDKLSGVLAWGLTRGKGAFRGRVDSRIYGIHCGCVEMIYVSYQKRACMHEIFSFIEL